MVIFAFGTTPPWGSVIVPARVARSRFANAADARRAVNRAIRGPIGERNIPPPKPATGQTAEDSIINDFANQYRYRRKRATGDQIRFVNQNPPRTGVESWTDGSRNPHSGDGDGDPAGAECGKQFQRRICGLQGVRRLS